MTQLIKEFTVKNIVVKVEKLAENNHRIGTFKKDTNELLFFLDDLSLEEATEIYNEVTEISIDLNHIL